VALRRRQAQIARKDTPDKAWAYLQQALALSPGEMIVLADLTELAEELGRYDELAELVQNWQAVEGDASRAMTLSIRRADALLRGGQRDQARALLASLEATAPGFIVLTSAAERDAFGRNDPQALASTYLAAAHAALLGTWLGPGQEPKPDPQAAAALYVQGAELLAYEVGTPEAFDEARAALGKALEAVPGYPPAIEALIELDDTTGNLVDALARVRGLLEKADTETKRSLCERAVRLARSHGDLEALLEFQRMLVDAVPSEMALRWRLEATLAQLGKDEERIDLLVKIGADETDATGRGTALLAAARLRERTGAVEAATELYRSVLQLWPEDTFARESLLDLLRAQEKWHELVTERRAEARALPDGPAARRALREAAWVLEVRLDDAAQAAQIYEEWLTRIPDDRAALEGLARCRAKFGDRHGEAATRGTLAEMDPSPNALWLHARTLERAGQLDEAAEVYRTLIASEEASIAATNGAIALADIAAQKSDTVMRVEAMAALAGRTSDSRVGGALAEDSGWLYALVLEDYDRAAQSFEAAIALDPTRRGAQLGAALVAARRAEPAQLARAYEGLAASVQMPEAAAALLLRGAAIAAANADLDLANQRVATARNAAPDDTSALLVLAETSASPHGDAADAFAAVDPLLARAEVLEMRSELADDPAARASWELERAEALELAGRMREAGAVVAAVLKTTPDDVRALSALRRMAKRVGDKATAASAAYALARVLGDRQAKVDLLREAAAVFDGPGLSHNTDYAIASLRRILANEPGAPEFDRLLELLRERADARALINAITERLTWHEAEGHAADFTIPLLLERATVVHGLGDTEAAMADLDALLERAPTHVEALRFRADLAFNAGDVQTAVVLWRRYLQAEHRPARRREIELQLAQVLAENTNDIGGAIEQMERVVEANPEDTALRERLLGLCLRAMDWERAVRELRALARMRPTPQEKAREELRLALLLRDRLNDRANARMALDRARTLDPLNLDVVRELVELLEPSARTQILGMTAQSFRESIQQNPRQSVFFEKLAQVNSWESDVDARWVALVAVEALGTPSVDQRQVLVQGRQQQRAPSRVRLDEAARKALRGPLGGPLHDLWRAIAPAVQTATGVDLINLGFARGDRIALKKLGDRYEALATALFAFGIDDVDIYINAGRNGFARALAAETPMLCLGADVAAAATPHTRFLLGRTVATIAEGIATLPELRDGELAWTIAASLRAVDVPLPAAVAELVLNDETSVAERAKLIKKELSRKAKAAVIELARSKGNYLGAVDELKRAALSVGHRAGLAWCGDLGVALSVLDVGRGGRSITDSNMGLELTAWSISEEHLRLREKLGIRLGAR
jgi:tetratricopeptide (TPR) repeat protein